MTDSARTRRTQRSHFYLQTVKKEANRSKMDSLVLKFNIVRREQKRWQVV